MRDEDLSAASWGAHCCDPLMHRTPLTVPCFWPWVPLNQRVTSLAPPLPPAPQLPAGWVRGAAVALPAVQVPAPRAGQRGAHPVPGSHGRGGAGVRRGALCARGAAGSAAQRTGGGAQRPPAPAAPRVQPRRGRFALQSLCFYSSRIVQPRVRSSATVHSCKCRPTACGPHVRPDSCTPSPAGYAAGVPPAAYPGPAAGPRGPGAQRATGGATALRFLSCCLCHAACHSTQLITLRIADDTASQLVVTKNCIAALALSNAEPHATVTPAAQAGAAAGAAGLCAWYYGSRHWLGNNLLGLAFSLAAVDQMSLGSVKTAGWGSVQRLLGLFLALLLAGGQLVALARCRPDI